VIATFGRPSVVTATVSHLMKTQTLKPSALIISVARAEDAGAWRGGSGILHTGLGGISA